MRITAIIEDCEITVDDDNSPEPASSRWSDQHERIKELTKEVTESCIELHKQKISDDCGFIEKLENSYE